MGEGRLAYNFAKLYHMKLRLVWHKKLVALNDKHVKITAINMCYLYKVGLSLSWDQELADVVCIVLIFLCMIT